MLNVRKLKQDFPPSVLEEGKELFDGGKVETAKIVHIDGEVIRIHSKVMGQYGNTYESEIEIDRLECETIDSDCDCPYNYDCQHIASLLFYLEKHLDEMLVSYSSETDINTLTDGDAFDEKQKEELFEAVKEAVSKEEERRGEELEKELLSDYVGAANLLGSSPFFLPQKEVLFDKAELMLIFNLGKPDSPLHHIVELQFALRIPFRSKPLHIQNGREFLESIKDESPLTVGSKTLHLTLDSFPKLQRDMVELIIHSARSHEKSTSERGQKSGFIERRTFGMLLALLQEKALKELEGRGFQGETVFEFPEVYEGTLEKPLAFAMRPASIEVLLDYIKPPASKVLLNPSLIVDEEKLSLHKVGLLECTLPGFLHEHVYYRFDKKITKQHLVHLQMMEEMTIPEPLFGTFAENALPEMMRFAAVPNGDVMGQFTTLPYVEEVTGYCALSYLNEELEASLSFQYGDFLVPASSKHLTKEHLNAFTTSEGTLARNLSEEKELVEDLFTGFVSDQEEGTFVTKSEKRIVEFMTEVVPKYQDKVSFDCPQNLLDQFLYDKTDFTLSLSHHPSRIDIYTLDLHVKGHLEGIDIERLWECVVSKKPYIELGKRGFKGKSSKILVLDLVYIKQIVQLFDELGIISLESGPIERPLWTLANLKSKQFKELGIPFSMTKRLQEVRKQMLGEKSFTPSPISAHITAELRPYQKEGTLWLERLRGMYLSGILADDMGLGKTLQAIVALTQKNETTTLPSLIICPTSLLYNWKEEIHKFNPSLKVVIVDGSPQSRRKAIQNVGEKGIIVTSYTLLQKDVDYYQKRSFAYMILDEAQHIKNRATRNAKSVKMIGAEHRLILSGTPIENSLDEMWSLFDFLMPGFLSTYERFMEKYVKTTGEEKEKEMHYLKGKVAPFILRRMKTDVLDDLPPVSEMTYHCQLTSSQKELYSSYAASARDELVKMVERDGFDKVQIHVLATLTRLKQICCHPAIFAKEEIEEGDSAKYDMLVDLLQTLIEGGHKTVIFSQYTRMLQIMKRDLEKMGIRFVYLDGSSKNRLDIVKQFNEDQTISVFLVSLKAGGTGLNLVSADTVIHYDMWWNPAVESQATDRVYRMGQKQAVTVYKLVTLGSIEEKIVKMQERKKELVKKIVSFDEEAMSKLTWEDVLELLQG